MAELKDRLKQLRKERNMTQVALGKQLHYGSASITHYESGKSTPSISDMKKIAAIFNVSLDYLLGVSDTRIPYADSDESMEKWKAIYEYFLELSEEDAEDLIAYAQWLLTRHKIHRK